MKFHSKKKKTNSPTEATQRWLVAKYYLSEDDNYHQRKEQQNKKRTERRQNCKATIFLVAFVENTRQTDATANIKSFTLNTSLESEQKEQAEHRDTHRD